MVQTKYRHAEATTVIYCTVTFHLVGIASSSRFLSLVPLVQLNLIRSLHISWMIDVPLYTSGFYYEPERGPEKKEMKEYKEAKLEAKVWESILRTITNMKSLRELQVTIYDFTYRVSEKDLLLPLMTVRGVEDFMVELPWALEWANNPLEETLFEIRRPLPRDENTIDIPISFGHSRRRPVLRNLLMIIPRLVGYGIQQLRSKSSSWF
jgi:hypothetical protein